MNMEGLTLCYWNLRPKSYYIKSFQYIYPDIFSMQFYSFPIFQHLYFQNLLGTHSKVVLQFFNAHFFFILFYADDMLIFSNGSFQSISHLKNLIHRYEISSGQKMHFEKSAFHHSKKIPLSRVHRIETMLYSQISIHISWGSNLQRGKQICLF